MGLKSKDGDRTEKIIRSLLKLPENRRCINCNSLGPQYVCTTFWTFVCTNCSGIHREFTHRVKSVSMAKFSVDEVNSLQAGGNEQARSIYFKTWNPLRNSYPDSSNMTRLRDFIKSVYVDRRYTGESPHNNNRFSRWSLSVREDSYDRRHSDFSGERYRYSERFDDRNDRCYIDERSQSSVRENSKLGGSSRGSFPAAEPEDRLHDSPILNRSATQMFTTADLLPERYSPRNAPVTLKNMGTHSPGRSQIFGDNFLNLQVRNQAKFGEGRENDGSVRDKGCGEASKANKTHCVDNGSPQVQKIAPPNNLTRKSEADNTKKGSNSKSLFDAPTKHETPNTSTVPQTDLLMQDGDANSAPSEPPVEDKKASTVPPKNTLEYLLFELGNTTNEPTTGDKSKPHIIDKTAQTNSGSATLHSTESASVISSSNTETGSLDLVFPALPYTERTTSLPVNVAVSSNDPSLGQNPASLHTFFSSANDKFLQPLNGSSSFGSGTNGMTKSPSGGGQTMNCHGMPPALPVNCNSANGLSSCEREANLQTGPNYIDTRFGNSVAFDTPEEQLSFLQQPQNTAVPSSILSDEASKSQLVSSSSSVGPLVQSSSGQAECANHNVRRSASPALANSTTTTRKEIPADLFASLYTSGSAVNGCGWHNFPNYGTGFNMQPHNASAQGPALSQAPRSRNPFDLSSETSQGHDATAGFPFPSVGSLQGPLFNLPSPQGFSSYYSQPPAQGLHMGQQSFFNSNMVSPGLQGEVSFGRGRGGEMIGPFDPSRRQPQHQIGGYGNYSAPAPTSQRPYGGPSAGGNPFG